MMAPIRQPPILSRKVGRVEYWPTGIRFDLRDGVLVGTVTSWGPKHSRTEPDPEPSSRRGVLAQGALNL